MSEPDNHPGRRPPTIELTATEIEQPASTPDPAAGQGDRPGAAAGGKSNGRLAAHAVSAVAGAIAAAVVVTGLWLTGLPPPRQAAVPLAATALPSATEAELSARLDKIEKTSPAPPPDPALGSRLAAVEAATKALGDSLGAANRQLDNNAKTAQNATQQAAAAAAAADAAKSAAQANAQRADTDRSDIEALATRIAAIEPAVKALSDVDARRASGADDNAARLAVAAIALRATAERGVSYQAELAAVQALGVDRAATAPLDVFAETGIPSSAVLAHELAALTPDLEQRSDAARGDASFFRRLQSNAEKLVRVTPVDAPPGNDPSSVMVRINVDAARGDIAASLADIGALPAPAQQLAAAWVKKAEAREAALAASQRVAAAALAALAKPAVQ
jgi:hypothetical protein